ncbi:Apoptosis inhibitor 5 [Podila minutissima]|nr:Apoptosis inhibitor 5 [Podila minutissima]
MADLEAIYDAYNEIMDAKENASQHSDAYLAIVSASRGSEKAKTMAARYIPAFFKHFPDLHLKAIDGFFDLCEDESQAIRQQAIKLLPALCKDGPQHTIKIADVLCQLLQLDDDDLATVQGALETLMLQSPREVLAVIFRQGVKGKELREKSLDFITNNVIATKETLFKDPEIELFFIEEMQKAMESVPDEDFATFARIIMNSGPYKTGKLDLADLLKTYIAHITSEKPFNTADEESIKRLLSTGKFSMPIFKRTISADPLLEFYAQNILPVAEFRKIDSKKKTSLLRLYSDAITSGFPSATVLQQAGGHVVGLLADIVPEEEDDTLSLDLKLAECLAMILNFISTKHPEIMEDAAVKARFRNVYRACQNEVSRLRSESDESKKKPAEDICKNIIAVTQEFLKPRQARTHPNIIPSWTPKPPVPSPQPGAKAKEVKPSPPKTVKTPTKAPLKAPLKPAGKANIKGSKPAPQQQQQQQQKNQAQGSGSKRKAEQEPPMAKKPKILRRSISTAIDMSPRGNSPGQHGNKHTQQHQHQQHQHQHHQGKPQSKQQGRPPQGRRPSPPSRVRTPSGGQREGKGRISFLTR